MPAIVPAPKIDKYIIAQIGSRMMGKTSNAIAAEPARPCTTPMIVGRNARYVLESPNRRSKRAGGTDSSE
jgi:hypothetical protein